MVMELPESAAHLATDPNRVYYVGAGYNPCLLPGLLIFLTRPCLRPSPPVISKHNKLDGLRQGLVSHCRRREGCRPALDSWNSGDDECGRRGEVAERVHGT